MTRRVKKVSLKRITREIARAQAQLKRHASRARLRDRRRIRILVQKLQTIARAVKVVCKNGPYNILVPVDGSEVE
jgi:hypothetical protein